jgi:hypothetical protein
MPVDELESGSAIKDDLQDDLALGEGDEIVIEEETAFATMLVQYDVDC